MSNEDLMRLRRTVRRDGNISDGAARLFGEIVDLHMLRDGCFARDRKLAEWLETSIRTIRRRRKELERAGYLQEESRESGRFLRPSHPQPDKSVRTKLTESDNSVRTEMANPDKTDRTNVSSPDKTGHSQPDNSVQDIENNNTSRRGGEGVHARARDDPGGSEEESSGTSIDEITEEVLGTRLTGITAKDQIRQICEEHGQIGWETLREVCHEIDREGWSVNSALVKKRLTRQLEMIQGDDSDRTDTDGDRAQAPAGRGGDWGDYA